MKKQTYWKVLICCISFLSVIYGLAHMEQGYRKQKDEQPTMAERKTIPDKKAEKNDKIMYLTFNDSPSSHTEAILHTLNQYHIKATFFVSGMQPQSFDLIKKIKEQGHAIGIHTYSHDINSIYASRDAYFQDLEKIENLVQEKTGSMSCFLRFPGGTQETASQHPELMEQLIKEIKQKGYQYYDWNAEIGDADTTVSPKILYENAMHAIEGKNEVMLLMHDGEPHQNTADALDHILSELIRQGWEFRIIEDHPDMPLFHLTDTIM